MNEHTPAGRDAIYANPLDAIAAFAFDERVVQVFPDMIQRSVPGYATIIAMTGVLAERYAQPGSRLYDLGCSLGASTLAMRARLGERACRIVAVDNAPVVRLEIADLQVSVVGKRDLFWRDDLQHADVVTASRGPSQFLSGAILVIVEIGNRENHPAP